MSLSPTSTLVDTSPTAFQKDFSAADEAFFFSRDPMSFSAPTDFPFLLDNNAAAAPVALKQPLQYDNQQQYAFPSPPASVEFDLDSFAHCSPASDAAFGLVTTPSSTIHVSPKTASATPAQLAPSAFANFKAYDASAEPDSNAAEVLSNHHLQRYFHYKALAAQAEAVAAQHSFMYPPVDSSSQAVYGLSGQQQQQPMVFASSHAVAQQQQATAAAMHAQAHMHMQARDVALAQAQQSREPINYYTMPSQRSSFESTNSMQPLWSRQSATSSVQSPPYPSTPNYPQAPLPQVMTKTSSPTSLTGVPLASAPRPSSEGEAELDGELEDELDDSEDGDMMVPSMAVANPNGGGRGYVPGQTPDDPKKKHKCQVCGRGFARAFNLKSHLQTHNPLRSKPHQCPHPTCKRGFSRLHDLERHRQGIHSDGPLVDAKRQNIPPAVARAQGRMQRRAEQGRLV